MIRIPKLITKLILSAMLCLPLATHAQGFGDDEDVEDTVPVDGGLSLLAAGGIAYGAKKLRDLKNNNN